MWRHQHTLPIVAICWPEVEVEACGCAGAELQAFHQRDIIMQRVHRETAEERLPQTGHSFTFARWKIANQYRAYILFYTLVLKIISLLN